MKKSFVYEAASVVMGLMGAALLVFVYFPIINPAYYESKTGNAHLPVSHYVMSTPVPVLILVGAGYFTTKARQLKKKGE